MADNAGNGVKKSPGKKSLERKLRLTYSRNHRHCHPPDDPPGEHGTDEGKINIGNRFGQFCIKHSAYCAIGCQFKRHCDPRRENRRHTKKHKPEDRRDKAYNKPVRPSAEETAEEDGDMHRRQSAPDLRDLSGQEGEYHAQSKAEGGVDNIFYILVFHNGNPFFFMVS